MLEQLIVNDKEISPASFSAELKAACEFYGLGQGGSKARLYGRILGVRRMWAMQHPDYSKNHVDCKRV